MFARRSRVRRVLAITCTCALFIGAHPGAAGAAVELDQQLRRDLVASLMVVGVTDFDDAVAKLDQGVGGIFISSWADPAILTEEGRNIAALREHAGRDFSVSIDFEGGRVQRHSQVLGELAAPRELAQSGSPEQVAEQAAQLGTRLADHGITVDFAPVLDVDSTGLDIVGDRSFGTTAPEAARYAAAFARGLRSVGIEPVFKHFPGHGAASGDTHKAAAVTPPFEQLCQLDLAAYGPALRQAPGTAVMVGHLSIPGLSTGDTPASLDPAGYRLLRSGAYPGGNPFVSAAYTDDLSGMKAISDHFSLPQAVEAAVIAGADQALWSSGEQLEEVIDRVDAAVVSGAMPVPQLLDAASRTAGGHALAQRAREELEAGAQPRFPMIQPVPQVIGLLRIYMVGADGSAEPMVPARSHALPDYTTWAGAEM
ncbi:glycoside hydrolase family 3 N-terminal domain-containing protein [Corynebacterium sp. Marseille-Q2516]